MSDTAKRALKNAIKLLLEQGHAAKWIAHKLQVKKDFIYRAVPEFFAAPRRGHATKT